MIVTNWFRENTSSNTIINYIEYIELYQENLMKLIQDLKNNYYPFYFIDVYITSKQLFAYPLFREFKKNCLQL